MDPILFFLLTLSVLLILTLICLLVLPEYLIVKELEKHVGKWISFVQLSDSGFKKGIVSRGKLFKVRYQSKDIYVCCFKSVENPNARAGFSWYNMPKDFDMSWKMFGETSKRLFYKDLKIANTIGEL